MSIPENAMKFSESVSQGTVTELFRNLLSRVATDNSTQDGLLEIANKIMINSGVNLNQKSKIITGTDATKTLITKRLAAERIRVLSITISVDGACNIQFLDQDDNNVLATIYFAAAGTFNKTTKSLTKNDIDLYVKASTTVNYSLEINYEIIG